MNIKRKLMAATAMLLVSTVMMTSASFAWFTISTKPEVTEMTSKVVVNENLEIALAAKSDSAIPALPTAPATGDTGDYYTWGNMIDMNATNLDGASGGNAFKTAVSAVALRPMALANNAFTAPTYGNDGRVNVETGMTLTASAGYGYGTINDTATTPNAYGYYVDLWVRTNVSGATLGLTAAADRGNGIEGTGSTVTSGNGSENDTTKNEFAAQNVTIAVKELARAAKGATEASVTGVSDTVTAATNTSGVLSATNLLSMEANTAYLIRVYVYMNGATVTNADAALNDGVTATVDLQFALYNGTTLVDMTAMQVPTATT